VVAVFGVATFIRATVGFGEALIAVPVLAFVLPVEVAAPVAMLISITVAAIVVVQDWRHVHVRAAGRLVLTSMFGIPLGLIVLRTGSEPIVKGALGLIVVAFSASALLKGGFPVLETDRHAWMFGLTAGVLGGAYGLNGPPLVAYGTLRRWPPERFRATLQGYFLPVSLMGMVGYGVAGLWTPMVTRYYLRSLPAVLVATVLGAWTSRRLPAGRFLAYVHAGLIVIGTALVAQAVATASR
jgi:hypothetical protein